MPAHPWRRGWLFLTLCLVGCRPSPPPDEAKAKLGATADESLSLAQQAEKYYPPEDRDLFRDMDGTIGENGQYQPLDLSRQEIIGRNAWMIWTGGNEAFWDWLARNGYGTIDLLKLIDSRNRGKQFAAAGLITEPGMRAPSQAETDAAYGIRYARPIKPEDAYAGGDTYAAGEPPDPNVYGFRTGILGLRLFPNPEFTEASDNRFDAERYYSDPAYASSPSTIRPFRVGMACSFCHVGPHPLNPPVDPEYPKWENLSTTIGAQYMRVRGVFGNTLEPDNYFYHVLDSQMPGTIDTSLIASDNINNANTMNAIFGLGWRVRRSLHNAPEQLSPESNVYPGLWDQKYPSGIFPPDILAAENELEGNPRAVARVLVDGSDSVGTWIALARVYLNIGSYHQRWIQLHNTIFGFRQQQPFKLLDCEENSVYWHATQLRVDPMTAFFLKSSNPMPLKDAPQGLQAGWPQWHPPRDGDTPSASDNLCTVSPEADVNDSGNGPDASLVTETSGEAFSGLPWDPALKLGRQVFARGCIACHSSIQPGNDSQLEHAIVADGLPANRTDLQLNLSDLRQLTRGEGRLPKLYSRWAEQAVELPEFWQENYLSTDQRIPVSLTETNSGRAMATNAMHDNIWEDFASLTYKELDSVGTIRFRDPLSGAHKSFAPPDGGPGYYRVPTLISAWATAPFFHNNALGKFNNDPTVAGRLVAYKDAMEKLLWPSKRLSGHDRASPSTDDDVSPADSVEDGGLVWRTSSESYLIVQGHQVPSFVAGMTGWSPFWVRTVVPWAPTAAFFVLGIALLASWRLTRIKQWYAKKFPRTSEAIWPFRWLASAALLAASLGAIFLAFHFRGVLQLVETSSGWLFPWLRAQSYVPALLLLAGSLLLVIDALPLRNVLARFTSLGGWICLVAGVFVALGLGKSLAGLGGDVRIGPFPKGMPVNLVANIDPQAPPGDLLVAIKALSGYLKDWHWSEGADKPGLEEFEQSVAPALLSVSKCPDLVLDRGHDYEFMQHLTDEEKCALIELVKTF